MQPHQLLTIILTQQPNNGRDFTRRASIITPSQCGKALISEFLCEIGYFNIHNSLPLGEKSLIMMIGKDKMSCKISEWNKDLESHHKHR